MQLTSGFRAGTKLVLWTLFLLQLLLIGVLWIYQQGFKADDTGGVAFRVNFVKVQEAAAENSTRLEAISKYAEDFQSVTSSDGFNFTCFREGTAIEQHSLPLEQCPCLPEWHGVDCGTPEVVWRALMTAKVPVVVAEARRVPLKVVYMITGYFYSLDLLEIQIKQVWHVVNHFVVCHRQSNHSHTISMLTKRLNLIFEHRPTKSFYVSKTKCTPRLAYKHFRAAAGPLLSADDIFIFSYEEEILNGNSIKFLQYYYDPSMGLIRFRLKYNVYGFYWQHPESTMLAGVISSLRQLDESHKGDPERLYKARRKSMIFGDLNHIGGWYCSYCYRLDEIIQKLQFQSVVHPKLNKNGQIDPSYIQNLIATGMYVDGKMGLNKLHRFADKYYAPKCVEDNAWKFDNLLVNLYLTFNDDDDYEK